jgi:hypothetical protein
MPQPASTLELSILVTAAMRHAAYAGRDADIDEMVEALRGAVVLYEQHPSHVHAPTTQFNDLVVLINAGRRLCARLGRADSELATLDRRAQVLKSPLH